MIEKIRIRDNDLYQKGDKIGWIEGNHFFDKSGKKVGYIYGNSIHGKDGKKIAFMQQGRIFPASATGSGTSVNYHRRAVAGGKASDMTRAAIHLLMNTPAPASPKKSSDSSPSKASAPNPKISGKK